MHNYDLDDSTRFVKAFDLKVPWAHSDADMQSGGGPTVNDSASI